APTPPPLPVPPGTPAVVAFTAIAATVAAAAGAAGRARQPARATELTAGPPSTSVRTALLINGGRVAERGPGHRLAVVTSAGGGLAGSLLTVGAGSTTYEIPAAAAP